MRLATWNVNSAKQRIPRLLPWLDQRRPDVVCLQETKLGDDTFADLLGAPLADRGYAFAAHGEAQWNGVAILSRVGLEDVVAGLPGGPGFPHQEARAIAATCAGIRVHSVYVPNGRVPGSEHYDYKLVWLHALGQVVAAGPESRVVCGDMNVAPTDADVFDPLAYAGQTHVTPPERAALADLRRVAGLHDLVRDHWPDARIFTYWDYRAGMFHQDRGMRIDLVLGTAAVESRVQAAWVDRQARKGTGPSDHAPVMIDLDEAPDGDLGPMCLRPPPAPPPGDLQAPAGVGRAGANVSCAPPRRRQAPRGPAVLDSHERVRSTWAPAQCKPRSNLTRAPRTAGPAGFGGERRRGGFGGREPAQVSQMRARNRHARYLHLRARSARAPARLKRQHC